MICYKNVVKMVCTYHFSKKRKVVIDLWQWHCRNRRKKNLLQLVCVNGITEIVGKKIVRMNLYNGITQIEGKKLLQLICGNDIAQIVEKKKRFDFWQ